MASAIGEEAVFPGCWACTGQGCVLCVGARVHPDSKGEAFLEESLEATTMHEPPAYPADKLEWHDLLRGVGNVD